MKFEHHSNNGKYKQDKVLTIQQECADKRHKEARNEPIPAEVNFNQ
jgi:hypothetical protein